MSEPARARWLWAILSLVLPVTFGHTTACRSPALAFSAVFHFAMKRSAPCSAALRLPYGSQMKPYSTVNYKGTTVPLQLTVLQGFLTIPDA